MGIMRRAVLRQSNNSNAITHPSSPTYSTLATATDGSHKINANTALAATSAEVVNPLQPGNWSAHRSKEVEHNPRYFTKQEAQQLGEELKNKREGVAATRTALKKLSKIDDADVEIHKAHRKYLGHIADNELKKVRSNAGLARKLHGMRGQYAAIGASVEAAQTKADQRVSEAKQRVKANLAAVHEYF